VPLEVLGRQPDGAQERPAEFADAKAVLPRQHKTTRALGISQSTAVRRLRAGNSLGGAGRSRARQPRCAAKPVIASLAIR
jgi:hypothetical protein